jgi:hypothetical protein
MMKDYKLKLGSYAPRIHWLAVELEQTMLTIDKFASAISVFARLLGHNLHKFYVYYESMKRKLI